MMGLWRNSWWAPHPSYLDTQLDKDNHSFNPEWDHIAIALKTGSRVLLERAPVQLITFLSTVRNKIIIGETPGQRVGGFEMIDVYTGLYPDDDYQDVALETVQVLKRTQTNQSSQPDENSVGWITDAHKNLPGLEQLYKKFPKAKWFMLIDDDTYVIKHNLKALLNRFDSRRPYYFGLATRFIGCGTITKWGDGPLFAHGGSGIVISRGAMIKLLPLLPRCIMKHRGCRFGDVKVALCLEEAGILLHFTGGFNKDPPNDPSSYMDGPCELPITFHHLLPHQIQELYRFEQDIIQSWTKSTDPYVTMANVFSRFVRFDFNRYEMNTDRKGKDIARVGTRTARMCQEECIRMHECTSFVFAGQSCWLKSGIPASSNVTGYVSGVISEHYTCSL